MVYKYTLSSVFICDSTSLGTPRSIITIESLFLLINAFSTLPFPISGKELEVEVIITS